ncbi:MAG: ATP-binding cassette domain-containing protein [Clostridia bacterium]|nr:ATP-binding cassette domain-containing protein [Clostridia bacterium]
MIEVKNLTKRYGDHLAVKGISFTVEEGHIYGFLGPNGAGKSTTMNIITGCLAATSGSVTVDGHDIYDEPLEAKRCVGYLPEQPPLYFDMTPFEYLMFVAEAKGIEYDKALRQTREIIEMTRLGDHQNRLIRNLSKGYRQRVGIAQAMLGDPRVIILDEPTVGLDPKQILEIRDLIRELGREKTVILSSHIMQEVQAVCDRVMIISQGVLVASADINDLESLISRNSKLCLSVRCDEATADEVLGSIEGIESAEIHPGKQEGVLDITLSVLRDVDPRDDIFFAMADRRCPIIAMQYEESKLEDIFLRLTEADAAAPAVEAEEDVQSAATDEGEAEYTSQFSTAAYRVEEENEEGKEE